MKKWTILLILVLLLSALKGQNIVIDIEPHDPKIYTGELVKKLDSAFLMQDPTKIVGFFDEWVKNVQPNDKKSIDENNIVKAVYDIYTAFYTPNRPLQLGNWEEFHIPANDLKNFVIQNKIYFSVVRRPLFGRFNREKSKIDSINNFKPPIVDMGQERNLYLTNEYADAIREFLDTEHTKFGANSIMSPALPKGESKTKYDFIKNYIHILHGHWGGYWHLETHPEVGIILINKSLTWAKILFRYGYQGGEAIFEKKSGKWSIKESKETWIE